MKPHFAFLLLIPVLFISSCGRKNNNFLVFKSKEKIIKINKLTFPAVRGLQALQTEQGATKLTWHPVTNLVDTGKLVGYNLYKFVPTAFIPRKPVNKKILKQTSYLDKPNKIQTKFCYLVRAVFIAHGKTIEGPASKIV